MLKYSCIYLKKKEKLFCEQLDKTWRSSVHATEDMCTSEVKCFPLSCVDLRLASLDFDEETKLSCTFDFFGWFAQRRLILAVMDQKTEVVLGML